jgi:hypothetical protein
MNTDNKKPLGDRRTPARQRARNEHAFARRINKHARHREPLMDIREVKECPAGIEHQRPTGPNDARLRAFAGLSRRPRSGKQVTDPSYRK